MTRKQRHALLAFFIFTAMYWGFYNWIIIGAIVGAPEKLLASIFYFSMFLPIVGMTYDNTSNN
jgi:hypothetical protein